MEFFGEQIDTYFLELQAWSHLLIHLERRKCQSLSCVLLFVIPWTVAHQAPLSVGFSRQEYWSRLPFPSPTLRAGMKLLLPMLFDQSMCRSSAEFRLYAVSESYDSVFTEPFWTRQKIYCRIELTLFLFFFWSFQKMRKILSMQLHAIPCPYTL